MGHKEADARLRNGHYLVFMHYSLYSHALYETHRLIILCAIFLSRALGENRVMLTNLLLNLRMKQRSKLNIRAL